MVLRHLIFFSDHKRRSRRHRKKRRTRRRSSSDSSSSFDSSSSSNNSSNRKRRKIAKTSTKRHRSRKSSKNRRKSTPTKTVISRPKPIKPLFDIETIQQNALMGCVIHEEIIRNKLMNQIQFSQATNPPAPQPLPQSLSIPPPTIQLSSATDSSFVQMNRDQFIERMANAYAENTTSCPLKALNQKNDPNTDWLD